MDFAHDEVDVAVRVCFSGRPTDLAAHFLLRIHCTPMCSPEFREAQGGLADLSDLLAATQLSAQDDWWERWFDLVGISLIDRAQREQRLRGLRLDGQVFDGSAALAHQGVAMLSPALWRADLAAGRLVQLFPQLLVEPYGYWLVYPEHKRNVPKLKTFREWLLKEMALHAEKGPAEVFVEPVDISPSALA